MHGNMQLKETQKNVYYYFQRVCDFIKESDNKLHILEPT